MNIYVGNMSYEANESDVRTAFEAFGQIESATIIKDKFTGDSKGFGFVEMPSNEEAKAAIENLNGSDLKGRNITVNEARPRGGNRGGRGHGDFGGENNRRRY